MSSRGKGWRTIVAEPYDNLYYQDNHMVLKSDEKEVHIPLEQIRELLLSSTKGNISLKLLTKLAEQNTMVWLCDNKRYPICTVDPISTNSETAGRIMDQSSWTDRRKDAVWNQIVRMKIKRQIELLELLNLEVPSVMCHAVQNICHADETNREAVAAKAYFKTLFQTDFIRRTHQYSNDSINSALNYGYSILCSTFARIITMHGYHTALGIHHCNRFNKYNLASDLIEPFRPFVDLIVYCNRHKEFDWEYKKELLGILRNECIYDEINMDVESAINAYVLDVLKCMEIPRSKIKEVQIGKASVCIDDYV